MIASLRLSTLAAWAGVLLVVVAPSCTQGPEVFCQSWADDTCQAAAACCQMDTRFDLENCKLTLTGSCQDSLDLAKIHGGEVAFDSDAARTCFGTSSCVGLQKSEDVSFDHVAACANIMTGFRRPGTGCNTSQDCAKAGAFATCFHGITGAGMGVCAKTVLSDDGTCGFLFSDNELRTCPDGTFCDTRKFKPDPNTPPSVATHEFVAPCHKDPRAGSQCLDPTMQSIMLCASGLFCDFSESPAVCKKLRAKGDNCQQDSECAAGLQCVFDPGSGASECDAPQVAFCFAPAKCGDQICEGSETPLNCPDDCGPNNMCFPPGSSCDPSVPGQCCPGLFCDSQIFICEGGK